MPQYPGQGQVPWGPPTGAQVPWGPPTGAPWLQQPGLPPGQPNPYGVPWTQNPPSY